MTKFGKRIYYDIASGNVILITNEMSGEAIKQTTPSEDRDIYIELSERVEGSYSLIDLEYGEFAQEFNDGFPTAVSDGGITWTVRNPAAVEEQKTLQQRIAEIEQIVADLAALQLGV